MWVPRRSPAGGLPGNEVVVTSLAIFVGVDSRGPASLYFATDSRISMAGGYWDHGQKAFASTVHPDIFAFCGDAFLPAVLIPQAMTLIDAGCVPGRLSAFDDRFQALTQAFVIASRTYPSHQHDMVIMHGGRDGSGMSGTFRLGMLSRAAGATRWSRKTVAVLPTHSQIIEVQGSGQREVRRRMSLWDSSASSGTSRAAFSAFAEAVTSGADSKTGGPPQLVGLFRKDPAIQFGILLNGKRYIAGLPAHAPDDGRLHWRNERFERASGKTKKRLPEAKRHQPR